MTAKTLRLVLDIRLTDIPEQERINLAADLGIVATAMPTLERTSPVRVGDAIMKYLGGPGADIEIFAASDVYVEIAGVDVVLATYHTGTDLP